MLAPARAPGQAPARRSRRSVLRTSLSRFLTVEVADATVTARTPGAVVTVRSDRDGYVDAVLADPGLSPGWHDVELSLAGGATVHTPVLVVSPDVRLGLVSDVDDTILETGLTRGLEFLRITLLTEVTDRAPLPGAAALYRALVCRSGEAGLPVFYLSTSPWNLHEVLQEFIALRGFPFGPLLLTDWGPGRGNLFRIGAREHKLGLIGRILAEHPEMELLLVGDTGQLDPEIYATAAREHPGRIRAIYVRRTGVLSPRPRHGGRRAGRRDHGGGRADADRRRQRRDRRARRLAGAARPRPGRGGASRDPLGRRSAAALAGGRRALPQPGQDAPVTPLRPTAPV